MADESSPRSQAEYYELPDRSFQILDLTQAMERVAATASFWGRSRLCFWRMRRTC